MAKAEVPASHPPVTPSTTLLDQLPEVAVTVRGRPLTEILRPAYEKFGRGGSA